MKYFLTFAFVFILIIIELKAQSDTLSIKMKDGSIDKIACSQIKNVKFENVVGVEEHLYHDKSLSVKGNYPNPFNQLTRIEFGLIEGGLVDIVVYNNLGHSVSRMENQQCVAGINAIIWNGSNNAGEKLQNGVYYYEIRYKNLIQTQKMLIVK